MVYKGRLIISNIEKKITIIDSDDITPDDIVYIFAVIILLYKGDDHDYQQYCLCLLSRLRYFTCARSRGHYLLTYKVCLS